MYKYPYDDRRDKSRKMNDKLKSVQKHLDKQGE